MSLRKTLFVICLTISALCLAVGYWIAHQWIGVAIALLIASAWLPARKYSTSQLPHVCLFFSVSLAVTGMLTGASSLWMMLGSAVALAVWDLLLLDSALGKNPAMEQTRQYEAKHLQALVLATSSGLFATLLGRFLEIQIPFVILLLFVIFILFALDRIWAYIKKTGKP